MRGRRLQRSAMAALACLLTTFVISCASDATPPPAASTSTSTSPTSRRAAQARPGAEPPAKPAAQGMDMRATTIARLPVMATSMAAAHDGSELLVGDRTGVVRRIRLPKRDGLVTPVLDAAPVLDLSRQVTLQFDRGFLNLALVDDGHALVVLYTGPQGDLTLAQYPYRPGRAIDATAARTLFRLKWPYALHHGGGLAVDPHGNLLVGIGDMALRLPLLPGPQDPDLLLGGVLSIPAKVLADPHAASTPRPQDMIARGLRNPWRLTVDPHTGTIYVGDVGDSSAEEIDRIDPSRPEPNFGYPYYEGTIPIYEHIPTTVKFTPPVVEHRRATGVCGMVAGVVYEGARIPRLDGRLLTTDLCDEQVHAVAFDARGKVRDDVVVVKLPEQAVGMAEGADGEAYALGSQGSVMRLDPAAWTVADSTAAVTGLPTETTTTTPAKVASECQVTDALEPFNSLGGTPPAKLKAQMATALATLHRMIPTLPARIQPYATQMQTTFQEVNAELATAGWDTTNPALAGLRREVLAATGPFTGFPEALSGLFDSGCG